MGFLPYRLLLLAAAAFTGVSLPQASESVVIRKAVFSDRQLFWPELAGKAAKPKADRSSKADQRPTSSTRIAVLPVHVGDYRESLPCDSCHRLSANGMEFFLENYFKDRMHDRFPKQEVELIAPNQPLLESRLNLMAYLDSLRLPWDLWLADSGQEVVYRPHDRFTRPADRKRLDKLGGLLGASYLLIPAQVHVKVTPRSSTTHNGGLDWSFHLVLWNVAAGSPEWALQYAEQAESMDLDESLENRLDKGLGKAWDALPSELTSLWNAEPR